jgi:hypothetical protein
VTETAKSGVGGCDCEYSITNKIFDIKLYSCNNIAMYSQW